MAQGPYVFSSIEEAQRVLPSNEFWGEGGPGWVIRPPAPAAAPPSAAVPPPAPVPSPQGPTPQSQMFNPQGPLYSNNPLYYGLGWGPGPGAGDPMGSSGSTQLPWMQSPGGDAGLGIGGPSPFGPMFGDYGASIDWSMYARPNYDMITSQYQYPVVPGTPYSNWLPLPWSNEVYGGHIPEPQSLYSTLTNLNERVGRPNSGTIKK